MTNSSSSNNNSPAVRCQSSAYAQSSPVSQNLPLCKTPGSASGSPTTLGLDMKRLLAKPAPPYVYPYGHSVGSGSESEGFSDSSRQKTSIVDRAAVPHKVGRSRSLQSLLDYRKERQMNATTPEKGDNNAKKNKERRPRNVLRRRPSTSTQLQTKKSSPALPTMTTTTATATTFPLPSLHSPLPPLSPRSPLTPSMFPAGSPVSPSFTLGSTLRQATAPSPSPRSGVFSKGSVSSFDKPLPLPPNLEDLQARHFGSEPVQAPKNEVEGGAEEYVVSVTDEKGKKVNPRTRLRELKGHPCPSSSTSSPSRSHPSSPQLKNQLHPRSSLNNRSSSHSRSHSQKPRSTESEFTSDPSTSLTPAAAVVAAYKEQENLHETTPIVRSSIEVDVGASMREYNQLGLGEKMKRPHTSSGHGRSATESRPPTSALRSTRIPSEEDGGKHRPYYTVFGTSSDHVITAGGPEDRHHLSWEIVPPNALTHKASEGGDGGGLRTLTRKMSGRFKRAGNGTQSEGEEEKRRVSLHTERERGRQSFQERSRTRAMLGKGEKSGLSLRLSIDKYAEAKVITPGEEKDTTPTSATKSRGSGTSTPSPSGGGSKIWKMMKRLSTGALREKFVNHEEAPPVPSLPREYAVPDQIQSFDAKTEVNSSLPLGEGFGKAVRKKASVILGVKMTSNCGSPIKPPLVSSPLASQVPTPIIRPSPLVPRPSTTTRSSSPVSSDVASSRFFANHKPSSMSAHSSTSSLPIEDNVHPPPPLPPSLFYRDSNVCQHIVPPSELGKMSVQPDEGQRHVPGGDEASPASPSNPIIQSPRSQMKLRLIVPTTPSPPLDLHHERDDYTITHTPFAPEMASLSLPPRRPGLPLGRMRRDTYASLTGDVRQDQDGEHEADEVMDEDMKEWEWPWGISSNSNLDADEKILDSTSGSPLIPSFSTDDPINTFSSKRTSTASRQNSKASPSACLPPTIQPHPSEMGYIPSPAESLPLPPRPVRSPQRPASNPTHFN